MKLPNTIIKQPENRKKPVFRLLDCKYYSMTLASVLALALGIGCNTTDTQNDQAPPIKNIPVIAEPVVSYSFYEPKSEDGLKRDTNYGYLIAKVRPGFKTARFERLGLKVIDSLKTDGATYYRLYKDSDVLQSLVEAKKYAGLVYIEPEITHELHDVKTSPVVFDNLDQYIAQRMAYAPYTIQAYDAWLRYGFCPDRKPIVASVDSGVRWRHEDLISQVKHAYSWWTPLGPSNEENYIWADHVGLGPEGDDIPTDGEELLKLLPDFTQPYKGFTYYSTDTNGHGTHTSGTIVATGNNGVGVAGVSWNNELIHYKCFNTWGQSSNWSVYGSIWHLARWKEANTYTMTIPINYSVGAPVSSMFALDMIAHGLQHGIMMVASSGNSGHRMVYFPAAYSGVIAVGATNGADRLANFSCWGAHTSVVAPGDYIISTMMVDDYTSVENMRPDSNSAYATAGGTSMAAPHVTGLIGYMLNFNPDLKPDQIRTYIEQNADLVDGKTGFSDEYGWGRINVLKTIEAVINDFNSGRTPPSAYVTAPVKIVAPLSGLSVYLYNCSSDGSIENYVASSLTGEYIANMDPVTGEGIENNVAYFSMLRPGRYIAKAGIGQGRLASTDPFDVTTNMTSLTVPLNFTGDVMTLQTFYTQDFVATNGANDTDTCIDIYDSEGNVLLSFDLYMMDSISFFEPSTPGDYYIRIYEFLDDDMTGEYAMWFTNGQPWAPDNPNDYFDGTPIAPGTYANPLPVGGSAKSLHAQDMASAQAIERRIIYYGRFNDASGTSGATGHWYKFTVNPPE